MDADRPIMLGGRVMAHTVILPKDIKMSKYLVIFVFLTLLNPAFSVANSSEESPSINWSALSKTFQAYVEYPSATNASSVIKLLPESEHVKYTGSKIESEAIEVIYQGLPMLQRQVEARERHATQLAFRLMTITDGASSEALDIMLGKLIRIDPKLFLEELSKSNYIKIGQYRFDGLVGNEGEEFVDKEQAQCLEQRLRIESLSKIKDNNLLPLRDICISNLDDMLNKYCGKYNKR